jgi:hypothetical protein
MKVDDRAGVVTVIDPDHSFGTTVRPCVEIEFQLNLIPMSFDFCCLARLRLGADSRRQQEDTKANQNRERTGAPGRAARVGWW